MKKIMMVVGTATVLGMVGAASYLMINHKTRSKITDMVSDGVESVGKSLKKL